MAVEWLQRGADWIIGMGLSRKKEVKKTQEEEREEARILVRSALETKFPTVCPVLKGERLGPRLVFPARGLKGSEFYRRGNDNPEGRRFALAFEEFPVTGDAKVTEGSEPDESITVGTWREIFEGAIMHNGAILPEGILLDPDGDRLTRDRRPVFWTARPLLVVGYSYGLALAVSASGEMTMVDFDKRPPPGEFPTWDVVESFFPKMDRGVELGKVGYGTAGMHQDRYRLEYPVQAGLQSAKFFGDLTYARVATEVISRATPNYRELSVEANHRFNIDVPPEIMTRLN